VLLLDEQLAAAWRDGPDRGGAAAWHDAARALDGDRRAVEAAAFAALAVLLDGGAPPPLPAISGARTPELQLLVRAIRLWSLVRAYRFGEAASVLGRLEAALADATGAEASPRLVAAQSYADLALADAAAVGDDRATARRRWRAVAARTGAPVAARIAAHLRLAVCIGNPDDLRQSEAHLGHMLALADGSGRADDAAVALLYAALAALLRGDRARARARFERIRTRPASPRLDRMACLVFAGVADPDDAMPELADGLRAAVESGDVVGYLSCVVVGAHRYVALGRRADALVTLGAAVISLRRVAPELADVVDGERQQLRADWGEAAYQDAARAALALLDADRAREVAAP